MGDEHQERMNVRTIRVTLRSALRHIGPEQSALCVGRALQLIEHARSEASSAAAIAEIDELAAELRVGSAELEKQG